MSFRHTYITQFLYKYRCEKELKAIRDTLEKHCDYGTVHWYSAGKPYYGYFHGVIKDMDSYEVKIKDSKRLGKAMKKLGIRFKIVYE